MVRSQPSPISFCPISAPLSLSVCLSLVFLTTAPLASTLTNKLMPSPYPPISPSYFYLFLFILLSLRILLYLFLYPYICLQMSLSTSPPTRILTDLLHFTHDLTLVRSTARVKRTLTQCYYVVVTHFLRTPHTWPASGKGSRGGRGGSSSPGWKSILRRPFMRTEPRHGGRASFLVTVHWYSWE